MQRARPLLLVVPFALPALALFACGGGGTATTPGNDASADVAPASNDASTNAGDAGAVEHTDAGTDAAEAGGETLEAPIFDTLKPNASKTLTVGWTNVQKDCDGVEAWRKDALDPYVVVFTAPGTASSQDDPGATQNINYTYKLRCKKGSSYSPFSYELSANPQN